MSTKFEVPEILALANDVSDPFSLDDLIDNDARFGINVINPVKDVLRTVLINDLLRKRVIELNSKLTAEAAKVAKLDGQLKHEQDTVVDLEGKLNVAKEANELLEEQLKEANEATEEVKKEFDDKVLELTTAQGEISSLKLQIEGLTKSHDNLDKQVNALGAQNKSLKDLLDSSPDAMKVAELEKKVKDLDTKLASAVDPTVHAELQKKFDDLTSKSAPVACTHVVGTATGCIVPADCIAVTKSWRDTMKASKTQLEADVKEIFANAISSKALFRKTFATDIASDLECSIRSGASAIDLTRNVGLIINSNGAYSSAARLLNALHEFNEKYRFTTSRLEVIEPSFDINVATIDSVDKHKFTSPLNKIADGSSIFGSTTTPVVTSSSSAVVSSTPSVGLPAPTYNASHKRYIASALKITAHDISMMDQTALHQLVVENIKLGLLDADKFK